MNCIANVFHQKMKKEKKTEHSLPDNSGGTKSLSSSLLSQKVTIVPRRQQQPKKKPPVLTPRFSPVRAIQNTQIIGRSVSIMLRDSRIVNTHRNRRDKYGIFDRDEIQIGRLLGCGGFSEVYEIESFQLKNRCKKWSREQALSREFYAKNAKTAEGHARFCIKFIKPSLMRDANRFNMAATDLVVEANILSSLDHPNILKVRAWGADGVRGYENGKHDSFFLVLDKMDDTLDHKIEAWNQRAHTETKEGIESRMDRFNFNGSPPPPQQQQQHDWVEPTRYALQIASALDYLHDKEFIFRDLKPQNVGIDSNGNIQIFDMGLARELPTNGGNMDEVFDMSGEVGTQRYSPPEVALRKRYNLKADCYTWALVFHEMLSLERPFKGYSRQMHLDNCCRLGERPDLPSEWPESIRDLMKQAWTAEIPERLTMKQIRQNLETILVEETSSSSSTAAAAAAAVLSSNSAADDHNPTAILLVELPQNFDVRERPCLARKMTSNATAATSAESHEHSVVFSIDSQSVSSLEYP